MTALDPTKWEGHTEGPWVASEILDDGRFGVLTMDNGILIGLSVRLSKPDAYLIAAAPTLASDNVQLRAELTEVEKFRGIEQAAIRQLRDTLADKRASCEKLADDNARLRGLLRDARAIITGKPDASYSPNWERTRDALLSAIEKEVGE